MMFALTITNAGKKAPSVAANIFPLTISVSPEDTVLDVKTKIAAKAPKVSMFQLMSKLYLSDCDWTHSSTLPAKRSA
jgi:hypothetical protein